MNRRKIVRVCVEEEAQGCGYSALLNVDQTTAKEGEKKVLFHSITRIKECRGVEDKSQT